MSHDYTVFPIRFSAQPQAMIAFYTALGLAKTFDHDSGTWAVFRGASGALAVHGLAEAESDKVAGATSLNLTVADVSAAAAELAGRGIETTAWDETFGKQGAVTSPDGRVVGLNEEQQDDLYGGYRIHEQRVAASLDVVAVVESADFAASAEFFAAFGFTPFGSLDDPWWCELRSPTRLAGALGLHRPTGDADDLPVGNITCESEGATQRPPLLVRLGFETSEPLDALAARLAVAGYADAAVVDDEGGSRVVVIDPDGQQVQIRPTS